MEITGEQAREILKFTKFTWKPPRVEVFLSISREKFLEIMEIDKTSMFAPLYMLDFQLRKFFSNMYFGCNAEKDVLEFIQIEFNKYMFDCFSGVWKKLPDATADYVQKPGTICPRCSSKIRTKEEIVACKEPLLIQKMKYCHCKPRKKSRKRWCQFCMGNGYFYCANKGHLENRKRRGKK